MGETTPGRWMWLSADHRVQSQWRPGHGRGCPVRCVDLGCSGAGWTVNKAVAMALILPGDSCSEHPAQQHAHFTTRSIFSPADLHCLSAHRHPRASPLTLASALHTIADLIIPILHLADHRRSPVSRNSDKLHCCSLPSPASSHTTRTCLCKSLAYVA